MAIISWCFTDSMASLWHVVHIYTDYVSLLFRFGPRESKKAMLYSDIGRLNCNVSYATFATTMRGQVKDLFPQESFSTLPNIWLIWQLRNSIRDQTTKSSPLCFIKPWKVQLDWRLSQRPPLISLHWSWNLVEVSATMAFSRWILIYGLYKWIFMHNALVFKWTSIK